MKEFAKDSYLISSNSPSPSHRSYEDYEETVTSPSNKDSRRSFVFLKEYVDTTERSKQDVNHSTVSRRDCTYCGEPVQTRIKIIMEEPNIYCHPSCFKCDICSKPMGDLKNNMFLRRGKVHCESCYIKAI
ncbi:zinc finger protein 185-like [Engraulis encrasicolus]|uniref:zinc finger protein 185-like n=1 Tax=Engraulis encrasicolus TaxID=184585 RepID=UPI002FD0FF6E